MAAGLRKWELPTPEKNIYEYQDTIIRTGCNFLREDIVDVEKYGAIIEKHLFWANQNDITIQFTLKDYDLPNYGNLDKAIQLIKPFERIIIAEAHNEFGDRDNVDETIEIIKKINAAGLRSSGGAWGNSTYGRSLAQKFLNKCNEVDIITMHRPYPPIDVFIKYIEGDENWEGLQQYKKPIIENEFLINDDATATTYAKLALKREYFMGFLVYGDQFEAMGRLCQEANS